MANDVTVFSKGGDWKAEIHAWKNNYLFYKSIGTEVTVYEAHEDPAGQVGSFVSLATNGLRGLDALGDARHRTVAGQPSCWPLVVDAGRRILCCWCPRGHPGFVPISLSLTILSAHARTPTATWSAKKPGTLHQRPTACRLVVLR